MYAISILCLVILGALCLCAVFSEKYRDNWLQFVGLWGVMLWAFARAWQVFDGAEVTGQQLWAHISFAVFAAGTAIKVWRYPQSEKPPPLKHLPPEHWARVIGRGK